jgi:hypothetical protein
MLREECRHVVEAGEERATFAVRALLGALTYSLAHVCLPWMPLRAKPPTLRGVGLGRDVLEGDFGVEGRVPFSDDLRVAISEEGKCPPGLLLR